jgi:hypothetical protein
MVEYYVLRELQDAPGDGRATNATLTESGAWAIGQATPGHLRHLRALVLEPLSPEQVSQLRDISRILFARLHPDTATPVDRQSTSR